MKAAVNRHPGCDYKGKTRGLNDAMELLQGKWKVLIIAVLCCRGRKRFTELQQEVEGISARMLTRELQVLELNQLVQRTVCSTKPVTVQYEITPYGKTLEQIVMQLMDWGLGHRRRIMSATLSVSSLPDSSPLCAQPDN
ncbi:DNA-binding transcriptional regulator, HxlR family [Chitinophaga eiseniae]|uniref:DNA-binding transcriptional regulator, HxlR family n=1 Tax=Chitinophaga eiseniae TaxID=634771 RepID=A0A1T4T1H8_9BACT|nr:helix-turn-helix domain-containing protein [Chitinophaga eiseniae]SKA34101.1 DNA-binding transcriptional regulator, HxlR family [Chitinophaga eiseniae]